MNSPAVIDAAVRSDTGAGLIQMGTGSLSRRMIIIAATWILILLLGGGIALDRVLVNTVSKSFDNQLEYVLTAMVASAEIGPDGEVRMNRPLGDQRFLEPNSGLYWQISGGDTVPFPSRSLWDRELRSLAVTAPKSSKTPATVNPVSGVHFRNSGEFAGEPLRIVERSILLPSSDVRWNFMVAQSRTSLDAQILQLRTILVISFLILGLGLISLTTFQTFYGLSPLRAVRHSIAEMRSGRANRVEGALPDEIMPMVNELNALLDHNEKQAEEARLHAGNLAHALKTPLTVIMNSATAKASDLDETVIREATTMRRQVDHHLARARAVGRRGHSHSRAEVWASLESVERAVSRLYTHVRLDMAGNKTLSVRVECQDLDEMLGNLIENAAKYGGGSVFVTIEDADDYAEILVEDDGRGIPESERVRMFDRGARLDTGKPGTGLGLAIVRDVAEIYDGTVALEESEDLGGLLVRLRLPKAN
jgi:signal transduction histidine kinase